MSVVNVERIWGLWRWHVDLGEVPGAHGWAITRHRAERAARRAWGIRRP